MQDYHKNAEDRINCFNNELTTEVLRRKLEFLTSLCIELSDKVDEVAGERDEAVRELKRIEG